MKKKPDAILSADWHLRPDNPICRTDDFMKAQFKKVGFIKELSIEYNCPVLVAGDLFNHWKPSLYLLAKTMKKIPEIIAVAGNHDLPSNSIDRMNECGFNVLNESGYIKSKTFRKFNVTPFHFGTGYDSPKFHLKTHKNVALIHEYVYKGRKPFPGQLTDVEQIMKRLHGYDLIVCGDNHKPFTHRIGKQLFVNSGSLTRQTADQIKHKPRVYLWYADTSTIEPVYLPIKKNVISRKHIKKDKKRDKRIQACVKALDGSFEVHLSFENNIKTVLANTKSKQVRRKIRGAIDGY